MYVLYIDGSGSVRNPSERHFVLAGLAVFERSIFHLIKETDDFVASLRLGAPEDVELHGSEIARGASAPWEGDPKESSSSDRRECRLRDWRRTLEREGMALFAPRIGFAQPIDQIALFRQVARAAESPANPLPRLVSRQFGLAKPTRCANRAEGIRSGGGQAGTLT